jgi:hypothetical protein
MTNEEAKNLIVKWLDSAESEGFLHLAKEYRQAIDMAIKALEPCEDAISRQAAIETIDGWLKCNDYNNAERHIMRAMQSVLYDLPPVTPKQGGEMRKETLQELSAMVKEIWRAIASIEAALIVVADDLEDEAEEVKE